VRWTCSRCGKEHVGLPFDWAFDSPMYWDGGRTEDDWLTEDLCVWTDDEPKLNYFIRGVLEIPVEGSEQKLGYGVWSSLSEDSFKQVVQHWDDPARTEQGPYFGWLSNSIPGYPDTRSLPLDVVIQEVETRPLFVLQEGDHPLIAEQREGITTERVRAIAEEQMHEA
jgi:hypothetical protein